MREKSFAGVCKTVGKNNRVKITTSRDYGKFHGMLDKFGLKK
jgi:hypothetical protein